MPYVILKPRPGGSPIYVPHGEVPERAPVPNNSPPKTILWGDGFVIQAASLLREYHETYNNCLLTVNADADASPCDYVDEIRTALGQTRPPRLIALSFYGHNLTTCMGAPAPGEEGYAPGSAEFLGRYEQSFDRIALAATSRNVPVYWITPPPHHPSDPDPDINTTIAAMATDHGWTVIDAGAAVADAGLWTEFLPCLGTEDSPEGCSGGSVKVRDDDLVNFEFVVEDDLTSYSSGALRWAAAAITEMPEFTATTEDCAIFSCPSA